MNIRLIRNTKFILKVEENSTYKQIQESKYSRLNEVMPNAISMLMSQIINTQFSFVCYEDQSLLGQKIEYNEDLIADEILNFINSI